MFRVQLFWGCGLTDFNVGFSNRAFLQNLGPTYGMYTYCVETGLLLVLELLKAMDALLWIKMRIRTYWRHVQTSSV